MARFKAKIKYTIDNGHRDYIYLPIDKRDGTLEYSDMYTIDEDGLLELGYDNPKDFIKEDLLMIAGGGYNYDHVHNVKFEITEI